MTYYKYFRRRTGPSGQTLLAGPFSYDTQLQRAGDTAFVRGKLEMCEKGFHACTARQWRRGFAKAFQNEWQVGGGELWAVQLHGVQWLKSFGKGKVLARGCTMLRQIPYDSPEGRKLRREIYL